MMSTREQYIKLGDAEEQRPQAASEGLAKKKVVIAAGFGLVMSSVLMLAWSFRSQVPPTFQMKMTPTNQSALALWGDMEKCYSFTGGTCNFYGCKEWRNAECSHPFGVAGHCTCPEGSCVGPVKVSYGYWDWGCYPKRNELIAESVTFKNVEWQMYIYASDITGMWLEKGTENAQFKIHKIPGPKLFNQLSMYTISPVTYPDYVLQMQTTTTKNGQKVHDLVDSRPDSLRTHMITAVDPAFTMFIICRVQGNQVRIGVDYSSHTYMWAATPHGTWQVMGTASIGSYGLDESVAGWLYVTQSMASWETSEEFAKTLDQCPEH